MEGKRSTRGMGGKRKHGDRGDTALDQNRDHVGREASLFIRQMKTEDL